MFKKKNDEVIPLLLLCFLLPGGAFADAEVKILKSKEQTKVVKAIKEQVATPPRSVASPVPLTVTPNAGNLGDSVILSGTGFNSVTNVQLRDVFGDLNQLSFTVLSDTQISLIIGENLGSGEIILFEGATQTIGPFLKIYPTSFVSTLVPARGVAGTSVRIFGGGFDDVESVLFNGVPASFTYFNDGNITATVPVGATTGPVTVILRGGGESTADLVRFAIAPRTLVAPPVDYLETPLTFFPLTPCRIGDTRFTRQATTGSGLFSSTLTSGATRNYLVAGNGKFELQGGNPGGCGIPIGAKAVSINVTAVNSRTAGFLNVYSADLRIPPFTSIVNTIGRTSVANAVIVPICQVGNVDDQVCTTDIRVTADLLRTSAEVGRVDVVIDVLGYFQ